MVVSELEDPAARGVRQLALAADVGAALTRVESMRPMLTKCTEALVRHLDAAFARVWTLAEGSDVLVLEASSGMYTHIDGAHGRVPVGKFKIGRIAGSGQPHLSNDVPDDPEVGDREWARREGMVSFAGYPLLVDGRVVGVMAMFARQPLPDDTLHVLASIADLVALGVHRKVVDAQRARLNAERDAAVARVQLERQQFYEMLMQAPGAIAYLEGPEYRFVLANEAYLSIARREVVGKTFAEAFPEADAAAVAQMDAVRLGGVPTHGREVMARLDRGSGPEDAWFDYTWQPWRAPDGTVEGILLQAFEVTAQVQARRSVEGLADELERRVQERTADLREANQELEAFSYTVSHDLRAPIRHIAGFVDLLRRHLGPAADDKATRYINTIAHAARDMGALIDGLLAFSRLGRVELAREPVDLGAVVAGVRRDLEPDLKDRQIVWEIDALPTVEGDPTLLRAALTNLLSNAVKYTSRRREAHITVTCAAAPAEYTIRVADDGVGFDMSHSGKLFGVFQRLHAAEDFPGTGIGLATVRRIIKRHGGTVSAEGRPDAGATFTVTLPRPRT